MPKRGDDLDLVTADATVDHLGVDVIVSGYTPVIKAVYSNAYYQSDVGEGIESSIPLITCTMKEFVAAGLKHKSVVRVKNQNYELRSPQPDGTGLVVLALRETNRAIVSPNPALDVYHPPNYHPANYHPANYFPNVGV